MGKLISWIVTQGSRDRSFERFRLPFYVLEVEKQPVRGKQATQVAFRAGKKQKGQPRKGKLLN